MLLVPPKMEEGFGGGGFGSQVKSPYKHYDSSYNPLNVEWGLRESTSVQVHRRMIITAEITECPTEPWNGE